MSNATNPNTNNQPNDGDVGDQSVVTMHDNTNDDCPLNNPETFASPVTAGLPCTCPSDIEVISENAEAGKWYDHPVWGRVLCCGTTGGDWVNAFAVRTDKGRTVMKYVHARRLKLSPVQSW